MLTRILIICLFFTSAAFAQAQTPDLQTPQQIEKTVREYFADTPVLIEIARCESKFRQFTDAGNIFRGGYNNQMIGVFQFYESVHKRGAKKLGHDLATLDGNLAYAQHLFDQSGSTPWDSSHSCWYDSAAEPAKDIAAPETTTPLTEAQMLEKIALLQQLIQLLQTLLELRQG